MTVALTGHRDLPPDFDKNALYDSLEVLIREGYDFFCCGMARGFDLEALSCLVDLKGRYHVRVEACIPYRGQENGFPPEERKKYRALAEWCEKTVLFETYFQGCLLVRNRYMVDKSDLVFAYCTRETGGTAFTVNYARSRGVAVKIWP